MERQWEGGFETHEGNVHVGREAKAIPCQCGGYCEEVETTATEHAAYGCGRAGCCDVAFICKVCGKRYAGSRAAPEME